MAANFWASSQFRNWQLDDDKVSKCNPRDREYLTAEEITKARIYYSDVLQLLGKKIALRQRVIASATIFFRRFYIFNSFSEFDPRLIAPTCLYLACKVEECITHARIFEKAMHSIDRNWPYRMDDVLEAEYYIIEEMDFYMVLYHPYRPLTMFLADCGESDLLEPAWYIVNDVYRTDLALMHPPHIIALATILMAATAQNRTAALRPWFAGLNVDMEEVWRVINTILQLYTVWYEMRDDEVKAILDKIVRKWNLLHQASSSGSSSSPNSSASTNPPMPSAAAGGGLSGTSHHPQPVHVEHIVASQHAPHPGQQG
ncbi:RNA polymerase II holoenzyme cyclin-like subunit [Balamuthia mandrillaris]